jgi:hypothetical protein
MSGFDLPNNYIDNLETLLRKNRSCAFSSSTTPLAVESFTPIPSATITMAKSLRREGEMWFYQSKEVVNTWEKCSTTFLTKFFPMGKTSALRGKILNF